MLKKILSFVLVLTILLSMTVSSFATDNAEANIVTEIQAIAAEHDFEIVELDNIDEILIDFDTVEELEEFLINFKSSIEQMHIIEDSYNPYLRINDTYIGKVYSPFSFFGVTGVFCWKNFTIDYQYQYPTNSSYREITKITNIKTNIEGLIIGVSWNQTGSSYNLATSKTYRDTAEIKVNGYWLLGVSLNGNPVGLSASDTWEAIFTISKS